MRKMVKHCCAVGCHNVYKKESEVKFYRFPISDSEKRTKWTAAVKQKNWKPNEYTWLCTQHFVSGEKRNNLSYIYMRLKALISAKAKNYLTIDRVQR